MFSREKALNSFRAQLPDLTVFIESSFSEFINESNLCAGFLCIWKEDLGDVIPIVSHGIPLSPFNISKKESLKKYIRDCLRLHPEPHIHSISRDQLWSDISSLVDTTNWQLKSFFIPACTGDIDFVFICFAENEKINTINNTMTEKAIYVMQVAEFVLSANDLKNRMRVMEIYVREIGHDIASSVQAIIAKLRNIRKGIIEGPAVINKVREAEEEIMATYRAADTLGITVDPDFNIGTGAYFDAENAVREVVELCLSEAGERHIDLRIEAPDNEINLWGDCKAIQSALMQIIMNAIKYARGSSYIKIRISEEPSYIEFSITDRGMSLDPNDVSYIWEFGWRGERAKELHVNGSGIGLYTVKKVVKAHAGFVSVNASGNYNDIVTFSFKIPKQHVLEKYPVVVKKY